MRVNIARTASGLLTDGATRTGPRHSASARSSPEAADDGGEDDQRDVAVDVEEGDVEAREVPGADERVLVDQEHSRSEEHTSELQSQSNLVCRLLLEKKKKTSRKPTERIIRNNQALHLQ